MMGAASPTHVQAGNIYLTTLSFVPLSLLPLLCMFGSDLGGDKCRLSDEDLNDIKACIVVAAAQVLPDSGTTRIDL